MKEFVFDFCGTLINKQTHSLIKFYCIEKLKLKYFRKYLISNKDRINFDIKYIRSNIDVNELSKWIMRRVEWGISLNILKDSIDRNYNCTILTVADEELIRTIMKIKIPNNQIKIIGSTNDRLVNGLYKSIILRQKAEPYFFTDHLNDIEAIKNCKNTYISEYSKRDMNEYAYRNKIKKIKDFKH